MSTPKTEHSSSSWCQSRLLRARREASRLSTSPALPRPDLGDQALEALAFDAGRTRLAEVVVDHGDALARPAEACGRSHQAILQRRALLVLGDLNGVDWRT
jgi:hypothetical protein